jgi:hypothetical protein
MTTIRVDRRDRFTTVDRQLVNDDRLSFRARGILVWLLDKPDGWKAQADSITRRGLEGRDAIRSALRELEAAGYLERIRFRDGSGRWQSESVIRETPGQRQDGFPALVSRRRFPRPYNEDCEPKTESGEKSTACGHKEARYEGPPDLSWMREHYPHLEIDVADDV